MSDELAGALFSILGPLILAGILYWAYKKMTASTSATPNAGSRLVGKIIFFIITIPLAGFFLMMLAGGVMSGMSYDAGPTEVVFECNDGKRMTVTYNRYSPQVSLSDGRYIKFGEPEHTSEGVRYMNADESIVFWMASERGNYLEESGTVTYSNCRK